MIARLCFVGDVGKGFEVDTNAGSFLVRERSDLCPKAPAGDPDFRRIDAVEVERVFVQGGGGGSPKQ